MYKIEVQRRGMIEDPTIDRPVVTPRHSPFLTPFLCFCVYFCRTEEYQMWRVCVGIFRIILYTDFKFDIYGVPSLTQQMFVPPTEVVPGGTRPCRGLSSLSELSMNRQGLDRETFLFRVCRWVNRFIVLVGSLLQRNYESCILY